MTPRERMAAALEHREPDRVPVDFGATAVTGIAAPVLAALRQELGLAAPGERVRVTEPYQVLGEVTDDLRQVLGIDTVGLEGRTNLFGYENCDWKPWDMPDGTRAEVPGGFNTEPEPDGSILQYPEGDRSALPSGRMPAGGFYFDTIIRQDPIDESNLDLEGNLEEFQPISDADLDRLDRLSREFYEDTPWSLIANFGGTAFGDIALVPAPFLKHPRGIRDVAEWYMSLAARKEFVHALFSRQCEIALANLERIHPRVGDRVQVVFLTGTDFGTQRGPFASPASYRELFQPYHKALNDWVHRNTSWKCFIHSCGGIAPLIPDFIDAGFDVLNPVQCSAEGMSARDLKREFGDALTFWGGAVDTQKTLPFGTPEEVRAEVLERLEVFAPGGGFVFNAIHNVQPRTPVRNLLAMFEAYREFHGR